MSRKRYLVAGLVASALLGLFLIGNALLVGTPRRPMTVTQADALVRRGLSANASVSQVKTWLDAQHIEHSEYGPHRVGGADGFIGAIVRDTRREAPFISASIQLSFTFDKQHRLIAYSSHEVLTGL